MTEQSGDSAEQKPISGDSETPGTEGQTPANADPSAIQLSPEGLPEWEPLTPELVEDEAIRGDFVIRWVVVGLALLLGISQISETRTLIHLKSGLRMIQHGFLPQGKDVFSYTASDRKWVNLPWLFDIVTAGIYSAAGGIGLSIFQGIVACAAFALLVHTVRLNIRTWWGSICAVLALMACYVQISVQPELVTLLGMSALLWILVKAEEPGQSKRLWNLVPMIWLWAQFDQRAWFGWFLLIVWAVGERLSRDLVSDGYGRLLGKVALIAFVVSGIHPFTFESWLAPIRMYTTDYPAMQFAYPRPTIPIDLGFYPLWNRLIWSPVSHRTVAALVLAAATLVTLFLNRSQVRYSHLFAFVSFNAMGLFATHELAAASLVNCVISTLNAQMWYREKFGQVYSIDWRELLFSRGGRAITVLSFFALAWLILSGRLDGPGGKRTGLGFDVHLANAMRDYQNLGSGLIDDRPFNFSVRQGDLLIWGGQKTFVDSRTGLFYGTGEKNLIAVHNKTRVALQMKRENVAGSGEPDVWKPIFEKYQIHQAWPRLNGPIPAPDYVTFADLLASGEFVMTAMNSSTAVFVRSDQKEETSTAYLKDHSFDPVQIAYRTETKVDDQTRDWAKPATQYDNLFSLRRPTVPGGIQAARHYLTLATWGGELPSSQRIAFSLLAIRSANEGLHEDPNCGEGYRILGFVYSILGQLESGILSQKGVNFQNAIRYSQSVAALQQALAIHPDDMMTIRQLIQQYETHHRVDIEWELAQKLKRLLPYSKSMTEEQRLERDRISDLIARLEDPVSRIESMVTQHLDDGADRFQIAAGAYQAGGLLRAIKTLEEDAIYLAKNPQAKLVLGTWLMEAGRGRDAAEVFDSLEGLMGEGSFSGWRDGTALSSLAIGNYQRAIKMWQSQADTTIDQSLIPVMYSLPFLTLNPMWMGPDAYPSTNIGSTAQLIQGVHGEAVTIYFQVALAQLETGSTTAAAETIQKALELNPATPLRPLMRFYLECITGEQIPLKVDGSTSDEFADLNAPDEPPEAAPETKTDAKPN